MKSWLRRTLVGLFGATALLGTFAVYSHGSHHGRGWHAASEEDVARFKGHIVDYATRELELDATQKAKLGTLVDKLHAQRNAIAGPAGSSRADVQSLIAGPSFDRTKAQALVQAKTTAVQLASPEVIAAVGDFFDSLRPEQQAKVRDHLARGGRRGWRG
jgi:Spy/CpxP family protein refolding chaperone